MSKFIYCPKHKNILLKGEKIQIFEGKCKTKYHCFICDKNYYISKSGRIMAINNVSLIPVDTQVLEGEEYQREYEDLVEDVTEKLRKAVDYIEQGEYEKAKSFFIKYGIKKYVNALDRLENAQIEIERSNYANAMSAYSNLSKVISEVNLNHILGIDADEIIEDLLIDIDISIENLRTCQAAKDEKIALEKRNQELGRVKGLIADYKLCDAKAIYDKYGINFFDYYNTEYLYDEINKTYYLYDYYPKRLKAPHMEDVIRNRIWDMKDGFSFAANDFAIELYTVIKKICKEKGFLYALLTMVPASKTHKTNNIKKCIDKIVDLGNGDFITIEDHSKTLVRCYDMKSAKNSAIRPTYEEQYNSIGITSSLIANVGYDLHDSYGVFILDDVITLGTQMKACRQIILECGVEEKQIVSLVIGKTVME